ncbi:MAG: prepilin-type N-terminal cleavage/methylation domain-containing protein [Bacteroidota bacterium]
MDKRKLHGFTLIEMLVSMALIGSVLMLGLYTYRVFVSFHQRYDQRLESSSELSVLRYQLGRDLATTVRFSFLSPTDVGLWDREGGSIAVYQQIPGAMIRTGFQRQDTFKLAARWIQHPTIGPILVDSAQLWQIPIRMWARSSVESSFSSDNFSPSVDISLLEGTNTDIE